MLVTVVMAALLNVSWTLLLLPVAMLLAAFFGLGVGFAAAVLNARYRDIQHLVGIVLSVAFFGVPIVYTPDIVPEDRLRAAGAAPDRAEPAQRGDRGGPRRGVLPRRAPRPVAAGGRGRRGRQTSFTLGWIYFRRRSMRISEEP